MKPALKVLAVAAPLLILAACAAGGVDSHRAAQANPLLQLVLGLWHGIIAPVTLVAEIGREIAPKMFPWSFRFYESTHSTVLYDIGFYAGLLGAPTVVLRRWDSR